MILTHIVMFKFLTGASASGAAPALSGLTGGGGALSSNLGTTGISGISWRDGLSRGTNLSEDQN